MNEIRRNLPIDEQISILKRGVVDLVSEDDLRRKLERSIETNTPLRVKLGADPTRPDLHLGHAVILRKMRQFQDLGHKVIMLIGDFTAMIGDPSGKSKTRPPLTLEETRANAKSYLEQCKLVLRQDSEVLELRYNGEWLEPMGYADVIRLASKYTVARILERDDFTKRLAGGVPIAMHELLYPLTQGYDSVALRADVELGGTDQLFNNLVGRALQRDYDQEPQVVITLPLLVGLDGTEKMSKSLDNYIGLTDEPHVMFAKLMKVPDTLLENYFTLLTDLSEEEIERTINLGHKISHEVLSSLVVGWLHESLEPISANILKTSPYLYFRFFSDGGSDYSGASKFFTDFFEILGNDISKLNDLYDSLNSLHIIDDESQRKTIDQDISRVTGLLRPYLNLMQISAKTYENLRTQDAEGEEERGRLLDTMYNYSNEIISLNIPSDITNMIQKLRQLMSEYLNESKLDENIFEPFIKNRVAASRYHSVAKGGIPENIPSFTVPAADANAEGTYPAARLMVLAGLETSLGAARRTITGKGLKINGQPFLEPQGALSLSEDGIVIQKGKDKFARMLPES